MNRKDFIRAFGGQVKVKLNDGRVCDVNAIDFPDSVDYGDGWRGIDEIAEVIRPETPCAAAGGEFERVVNAERVAWSRPLSVALKRNAMIDRFAAAHAADMAAKEADLNEALRLLEYAYPFIPSAKARVDATNFLTKHRRPV